MSCYLPRQRAWKLLKRPGWRGFQDTLECIVEKKIREIFYRLSNIEKLILRTSCVNLRNGYRNSAMAPYGKLKIGHNIMNG